MLPIAYYNEPDPKAAAWLRELIDGGCIAYGFVDERSIEDVRPDELIGYTQCHFFAGISGWSRALRLAGWPDDRPVWTGSCPCQPFSAAGKGGGTADERHLWPAWFHLIGQCKPDVVFGEQVEAAIRHGWLDLVQADMEGIGYAFGAVGLPAACVGAPHIRQRLWFVANSECTTMHERYEFAMQRGRKNNTEQIGMGGESDDGSTVGIVAQPESSELQRGGYSRTRRTGLADNDELGNADEQGSQGRIVGGNCASEWPAGRQVWGIPPGVAVPIHPATPGDASGSNTRTIPCADGKTRRIPVEPELFPLAHGIPGRVGLLRGAGNAIVPEVAQAFIEGYMTCSL